MKGYKAAIIVLALILADQALKIWVKTHYTIAYGEPNDHWFHIHFTENPGMAFGMVLPGIWGKLFLSAFRLVAVTVGVWYLRKIVKGGAHWGFITAVSFILAGAIGNMIDGTFYGVIFSDSHGQIAKLFPPEGGYSGWMQGLVVDMLHFQLLSGYFPKWVPVWGGEYFEFFRFIFNIADAAITIGVAIILIFQGVFFKKEKAEPVSPAEPGPETAVLENQNSANA